jgi:uncharacterized lipoprotein YddW (UPF0748 family)
MRRGILMALLALLALAAASREAGAQEAVTPASATPAAAPAAPAAELRGIWVTRFQWPRETEAETRARIAEIMRTLAEANFNAVFFQIRGQTDVAYPSPYEPWSAQFGWTDPGWDPVAYAIEQAHAHGLEFHAYINTHTLRREAPPPVTVPQHRFNLHGPESADSWVIHDRAGRPVAHTDGYVWLAPGHPDAEAWTRQAIRHVVRTYPVDGIHFDRIRTPGGDYSYDPRALARFWGDGNPDGEAWGDFMRSQITRQLRRIYGAAMLENPRIKVSAAPFGIARRVEGGYQGTGTESYHSWRQDSFGWLEQGVLDFIVPMIYWEIGSDHPFEVLLKDFLDHAHGRHVVAGKITSRDYIAQTYEARRQQAPGHVIFSYRGQELLDRYRAGPYAEPAPLPAMPWKDAPATALVAGTITNAAGEPVLDVAIRREGDEYTYLTGADGFYAILNIPPGRYTITAHKSGYGHGRASRTVEVRAGDRVRLDLVLGRGP